MKNLNKLAFGILVGAMAIGFSAFTKTTDVAAGDQYGSRVGSNPYEKLSDPYISTQCSGITSKRCFYQVTTAGAGTVIDDNYTEAQLESWASQTPPLVTRSSTTGIYAGN